MKKFLSFIGFIALAFGLIIGSIFGFSEIAKNDFNFDLEGWKLGVSIALFFGGISSAIFAIASFFKSKVKTSH